MADSVKSFYQQSLLAVHMGIDQLVKTRDPARAEQLRGMALCIEAEFRDALVGQFALNLSLISRTAVDRSAERASLLGAPPGLGLGLLEASPRTDGPSQAPTPSTEQVWDNLRRLVSPEELQMLFSSSHLQVNGMSPLTAPLPSVSALSAVIAEASSKGSVAGVQPPLVEMGDVTGSVSAAKRVETEVTHLEKKPSWEMVLAAGVKAQGCGVSLSPKSIDPSMLMNLRAVVISSLPAGFSMHNVSRYVRVGPVQSITMHWANPDKMATGTGAHSGSVHGCTIVFWRAQSAWAFLADNCRLAPQSRTALYIATMPRSATCAMLALGSGQLARNVPGVRLNLGPPQEADHGSLHNMASPTMARRRLKWSRARLFIDMPMSAFKRDILRLVGHPGQIECFHFYSTGEATVIFDSVNTAMHVLRAFTDLRSAQRANGRSPRSWRHVKIEGDYGSDVVVSYARDFNESPVETLHSAVGNSARRALNKVPHTLVGLYQGPPVSF